MRLDRSFRFADENLNRLLLVRMKQARIDHRVEKETVYYSAEDEEKFEDVLTPIRSEGLGPWQVLSCPPDMVDRYRRAMEQREVPYEEEINNGNVEFLIPLARRPHSWKFDAQEDRAMGQGRR